MNIQQNFRRLTLLGMVSLAVLGCKKSDSSSSSDASDISEATVGSTEAALATAQDATTQEGMSDNASLSLDATSSSVSDLSTVRIDIMGISDDPTMDETTASTVKKGQKLNFAPGDGVDSEIPSSEIEKLPNGKSRTITRSGSIGVVRSVSKTNYDSYRGDGHRSKLPIKFIDGATEVITFNKYNVDGVEMSGLRTTTTSYNDSAADNVKLTFTYEESANFIYIEDATANATATRNTSGTIEYTTTSSTLFGTQKTRLKSLDATENFTSSGINRAGESYTSIGKNLIRKSGKKYFTSGTITDVVTNSTRVLTFGLPSEGYAQLSIDGAIQSNSIPLTGKGCPYIKLKKK